MGWEIAAVGIGMASSIGQGMMQASAASSAASGYEAQAEIQRQLGESALKWHRKQARKAISTAYTQVAASGVDIASPSSVEVVKSMAQEYEWVAQMAKYGYTVEAYKSELMADAMKGKARSALLSGGFGAFGELFGGAIKYGWPKQLGIG